MLYYHSGGDCNNNLTIDCFEHIAIGKGVFISKNVRFAILIITCCAMMDMKRRSQ